MCLLIRVGMNKISECDLSVVRGWTFHWKDIMKCAHTERAF